MKFEPVPCVVPNMRTWGAVSGNSTYLISIDDEHDGLIQASVKPIGALPFDKQRHDLGEFSSFAAAEAACRHYAAQAEN